MMIGLLGMAYYSAPASSANYSEVDAEDSEGSDYSALRTSSADEDDFVDWGCLPRSASNYGYLFGRQAGQSRETFPKIFIPGHNK